MKKWKTSIPSCNEINIPQKVCLYLAVMNLSSPSTAKLNKPMLYWTQWARHPGRLLTSSVMLKNIRNKEDGENDGDGGHKSSFDFTLLDISSIYNNETC